MVRSENFCVQSDEAGCHQSPPRVSWGGPGALQPLLTRPLHRAAHPVDRLAASVPRASGGSGPLIHAARPCGQQWSRNPHDPSCPAAGRMPGGSPPPPTPPQVGPWPGAGLQRAVPLCLQKSAILTTIGVLEEPLGNARLHGARLVAALLHTNTPSINRELCRLNTMGLLLVSGRTGQGRRAGRSRSRCGPQSREAGAHAARSSSRGREAAAVPLCLRERPLQLCVNVPRERPSAAPLPEPSSDRGCACPACASRLPGGCPGSEQAVGARGRAPPRHTTLGSPGSPSALPVGLCS